MKRLSRVASSAVRLAVLLVAVQLGACLHFVSWKDVMSSWVGKPVETIHSLWGAPTKVWQRDDGITIHRYDLRRNDPSCVHFWEVNAERIIVGFYYEGHCRPVG